MKLVRNPLAEAICAALGSGAFEFMSLRRAAALAAGTGTGDG